ncbi:hypothetical protein EDB19DRAFT_747520 [Suillus lakei]|nr:hypothetical protein EDB19DRAFT_747520 [Suillus lakei]
MAKGLQFLTYICASMATFWTYDYACSFHEEWTFLLRSRWTKVKCLYIITRYVPFLLLVTELYVCFIPNENPNKCRMGVSIYSCLSMISVACSELFFVLRTHALWGNNRIVLMAMLSAHLAVIVASTGIYVGIAEASQVTISAIPGITGCYRTFSGVQTFAICFLLLFALQLGLVFLTLIRAMQSWRTANGPLYDILVKHNTFYYTCGLLLSAVNALMQMVFSQTAYRFVCEVLQFVVLAILATRMHLYLWQIDQRMHGSQAFVHIPMSDMSSTNYAVTEV